ncbi:MAG: hypothetical protein QM642_04185 [Edaphocola sp.]
MKKIFPLLIMCCISSVAYTQQSGFGINGMFAPRFNLMNQNPQKFSFFSTSFGFHYKFVPQDQNYYLIERLSIEDNLHTIKFPSNVSINLALWNIENSIQIHAMLTNKLDMYFGLNVRRYIDADVIQLSSYENSSKYVFMDKDIDEIGYDCDSLMNKFNAGFEIGGIYKLNERLKLGFSINYFVLKTMYENLKIRYSLNYVDFTEVSINSKPINMQLRILLDFK